MGGHAAKVARDDIEKNLGETVITKKNTLNYKYLDDNKALRNTSKKKLNVLKKYKTIKGRDINEKSNYKNRNESER